MTIKQQRIIYTTLMIVVMIGIFCFSSQTGEDSSETSGRVLALLKSIPFIEWVFPPIWGGGFDASIRKWAHFYIYFLLGITTFLAVDSYRDREVHDTIRKKEVLLMIVICAIYACSDELHQSFVPERGPAVRDVLIDTVGSGTGISCVYLVKKFWGMNKVQK